MRRSKITREQVSKLLADNQTEELKALYTKLCTRTAGLAKNKQNIENVIMKSKTDALPGTTKIMYKLMMYFSLLIFFTNFQKLKMKFSNFEKRKTNWIYQNYGLKLFRLNCKRKWNNTFMTLKC